MFLLHKTLPVLLVSLKGGTTAQYCSGQHKEKICHVITEELAEYLNVKRPEKRTEIT
jgi:hypothetical protein